MLLMRSTVVKHCSSAGVTGKYSSSVERMEPERRAVAQGFVLNLQNTSRTFPRLCFTPNAALQRNVGAMYNKYNPTRSAHNASRSDASIRTRVTDQ